jgi:hypothetical protein
MGVGPVAGTKLYIGGSDSVPSPDDYIEIKEIATMGNIAQTFTPITVESVGSGDSYDIKGTRRYPNFELTLNRDDVDPGQIALKAAAEAVRGTLYNFRIVENDGGDVTWKGEVFGYGPNYGGVNALLQVATSISIRPETIVIDLST